MALSERKDVVLDVSNGIPTKVVKNHEWPNALPVNTNRIVISYLFNPASILEEVKALDDHFKQLNNVTMAPFRNAVESKIVPLLSHPTLTKIYQSKPKKSKWNFLENKAENLVDELIKDIDHMLVPEQLKLLLGAYENADHKANTVEFIKYLEAIIFEKLDNFVCSTITDFYQVSDHDSEGVLEKKDDSNEIQEFKIIERTEPYLQQEQHFVTRNSGRYCRLVIPATLCCLVGGSMLSFSSENPLIFKLAISLISIGIGFFMLGAIFARLSDCHGRQVRFLTAARDRLFQPVSEAKPDNNILTESLLTPELQAEYKEEKDEESDVRPDSPRRERKR